MREFCSICGKQAECTHHLIFGNSRRRLADEDGLTLSLCNNCHNLATKNADRIHGNPIAEKLSKMLGQALYESWYGKTEEEKIEARSSFIGRYGRSYL